MQIVPLVLFAVAIVAAVLALLAVPTMLLWDWLMPALFGLPEITWLQACGLLVLFSLLFPPDVRVVTGSRGPTESLGREAQ